MARKPVQENNNGRGGETWGFVVGREKSMGK